MPQTPQPIYLADYQVPDFLIDSTQLRFELAADHTLVRSRLQIRRNPASRHTDTALQLDGDTSLQLCRISVDEQVLSEQDYLREGEKLQIAGVPDQFCLEVVTRLAPDENTALEGLYRSDGIYCTQCEAQGFRRITFYFDRPDVMSVFTTTIEADKQTCPVLLSNGNPVDSGEDGSGRHWVTWHDPFPKPAYLFALVAGDLHVLEDQFTTCSGRQVQLRIYAAAKDLDKLDYAMQSLKKAMRWDEQVYGREYDLDIYMIVAVDFFNMGAMENKGLNIFNTSCVLAHPQTTTDAGFQRVEAVVAHEYFHNWSGNRVTCRDWFQLSLKEGFTVFRDAEFSADMNSRTVKRVEDATLLRTAQFAEDAGPMAHPVRPASFIEISNFYTLTVYEKGAEVVRMLHTLLGPELFRQGSDLYFQRHDGQAVTTDDFVNAMETVSKRDLGQFRRWYAQAGTPVVEVTDHYDAARQRYSLTFKQHCPATPGQPHKEPFHIPVRIGLLDRDGQDLQLPGGQTTQLVELTQPVECIRFDQVAEQPLPSLLRGFSAPVRLIYPYSLDQLLFLISHDSDEFNRWDAMQQLAVKVLQTLIQSSQRSLPLALDQRLIQAYRRLLQDEQIDPAILAHMLQLPSEAYLSELAELIDVDAIHQVRQFAKLTLAKALQPEWEQVAQRTARISAYATDAASMARRAVHNLALDYLLVTGQSNHLEQTLTQYQQADNMTDRLAALRRLVHSDFDKAAAVTLEQFYSDWQHDALVVNQWLAVQAGNPQPGGLERIKALLDHPAFNRRNPNKVRSVIGVFCSNNPVNFHAVDGSGYRFLSEQCLQLDRLNPQIAARLVTPLTRWRRYPASRRQLMREALQQLATERTLSRDLFEVVSKSLA